MVSTSKMAANCCGTLPASIARNAKSADLARSITGCFPLHGPTRERSRVLDPTFLSDRVMGQRGSAQGHADVRRKAGLLLSAEKDIYVRGRCRCEGRRSSPRTTKGSCTGTRAPPLSEM